MRNLPTITSKLIEKQGATDFIVILSKWKANGLTIIFGFVWTGLDNLKMNKISQIDFNGAEAQIERNLTYYLVDEIEDLDTPLKIKHSPPEMTQIISKQAKPPEYDFAFHFRGNPETLFPFEAKCLRAKNEKIDLSDYVNTISSRFVTGIYAPYSSHVAMVGYLLDQQNILEILNSISEKINTQMKDFDNFRDRNHKFSEHLRTNGITPRFYCHHMIYAILKHNT